MERKERENVKIDIKKLDFVLARECRLSASLRAGTSPQTLAKIRQGGDVRPITVGKIAKALGVDVAEIIELEV